MLKLEFFFPGSETKTWKMIRFFLVYTVRSGFHERISLSDRKKKNCAAGIVK